MTASKQAPGGNGRLIWIGALVVVVLIGVVAVVASRGSKSESDAQAEKESTQTVVTEPADTEGSDSTLPPFSSIAGEDAAVGLTIPQVSGTTLDGQPLTIGPDGTAKVIVFVAHWCPHCQREVPVIAAHLKENPMPDDVELVAVSTSVAKERGNYPPKAWLDREGWEVPTLADSEDSAAAAAFGLQTFPYFVAVDADGKVVYRTSGEITTEQFDQLVEAAQTGQPPA